MGGGPEGVTGEGGWAYIPLLSLPPPLYSAEPHSRKKPLRFSLTLSPLPTPPICWRAWFSFRASECAPLLLPHREGRQRKGGKTSRPPTQFQGRLTVRSSASPQAYRSPHGVLPLKVPPPPTSTTVGAVAAAAGSMATEVTLDGILGEIQALVSDKLQVVSYKWLSRNFSVSSNDAKRLLQEFVRKCGSEVEVVYTLSGWLKKDPEIYNVRLVSGSKLTDAKQEFRDNYSIQVYSVQTCIPKDLAVLWSSEFVQTEELFDQPSTSDNCLRDNRFCGVSNSFVKRIVNGKSIVTDPPKTKIASGSTVPSKINGASLSFPTHQQGQRDQPKPTSVIQTPTVVSTHGNEGAAKSNVHAEPSKAHMGKEKDSGPPATKKVVNEKAPQGGNVGSLANLWGRASSKSKSHNSIVEVTHDISRNSATSDAQICAQEALDSVSSDDEGQNISRKESGGGVGRKRRVVFDFSDDEDEENIVSLASPEPQNTQSILGSKKGAELEKMNMNLDDQTRDKVEVKQEKTSAGNSASLSKGDFERSWENGMTGSAMPDKAQDPGSGKLTESNKRDQANTSISTSPKRKKVLKTRIDERGREVTEVVWEGDATERSNAVDRSKVGTIATDNVSENRLPPADKPAASRMPSNTVNKTVGTKTMKAAKDSKQANILSFFKKV